MCNFNTQPQVKTLPAGFLLYICNGPYRFENYRLEYIHVHETTRRYISIEGKDLQDENNDR